ncbi:alpha/beta hydrolase [Neobacillus mesonae]|nr:alpha/beta hydrolase [Neobacillus mesonae]
MEHYTYYEESYWGRDVRLRQTTQGSNTLVVFFPGQNYSCELPVLHYAVQSAVEQGMDVLLLEYGYQSARVALEREQRSILAEEVLQTVKHFSEDYEQLVFVSKSLGTLLAGYAAEKLGDHRITHLYLTPLDSTLDYIQHSSGLVIYGTKDSLFSEESRGKLDSLKNEIDIIKIPDAGHGLEVMDVRKSVEHLSELVRAYTNFFGSIKSTTY